MAMARSLLLKYAFDKQYINICAQTGHKIMTYFYQQNIRQEILCLV